MTADHKVSLESRGARGGEEAAAGAPARRKYLKPGLSHLGGLTVVTLGSSVEGTGDSGGAGDYKTPGAAATE